MENKSSPHPSSAKPNRVPSAQRWGSSARPISSLTQSSRGPQEPTDQTPLETGPKSGVSPKGRPLSSNVYLKKTIAQGWKAQEVPEVELSPGELDRLVGDEVESLGEKKKALEGMLTSQSLVTGDQAAQTDWVKGEVMIPDFHCERCRDHFYGLTNDPCDEEQERLEREGLQRRGKTEGDSSPKARHHREGGSRSSVPPQKRELTGTDQLISNSTDGTSRSRAERRSGDREGERDLIGGETEEGSYTGTKRGVRSGKKLTTGSMDQTANSLVNATSDGSVLDGSRAEKSINRSVTGARGGAVRESGTETKEYEGVVKSGETGTIVDSSHSRNYAGSEGVNRDRIRGTGGTGGTGGSGEGKKRKGRRRRKGEGGGSGSSSSSDESADGSEGTAGEGKKRKRKGGRGRRAREGTGSGTEGTDSGEGHRGGEGIGGGGRRNISGPVSGMRGDIEGDKTGMELGLDRERGEQVGVGVSESQGLSDRTGNRESDATGREGIGIEIIMGGSREAKRRNDRNISNWERGGRNPTGSAMEQRSAVRTEIEGQKSQLESPSQILNKLLTAKRPNTAYPVESNYRLALTQSYTFSYYKN